MGETNRGDMRSKGKSCGLWRWTPRGGEFTCSGITLPALHRTRKSVEPMAARVDPLHASARHPSQQAGLMFHSDRGSQYASKDLRNVLKGYGITSSMSRCGNCCVNACSEMLFGKQWDGRSHPKRHCDVPKWRC